MTKDEAMRAFEGGCYNAAKQICEIISGAARDLNLTHVSQGFASEDMYKKVAELIKTNLLKTLLEASLRCQA